jgi:PIN domain nuclease of toxin-antitoxin system
VAQPEHQPESNVRALIAAPGTPIFVRAAGFWAAAIKRAKGRLDFDGPALSQAVIESGLRQLSITTEHALAAGDLPGHHDDPFDRMLVAQAQCEGLTLLTSDPRISSYAVAVLPAW